MRRANAILLLLLGLLAVSPAATAQENEPTIALAGDDITVTEEGGETTYTVPTAGTYDVTVKGSGFTIEVFVLQCPGAAGSVDALAESDATTLCDLANLTPGAPGDDGTFEVAFEEVEVDACGLVFAAADIAQTESAAVVLGVEDPGETAVCEVVETTGYAPEDAEVLGTSQDQEGDEALATTGLSTGWLVGLALIVSVAGALIAFEGRRVALRRRS